MTTFKEKLNAAMHTNSSLLCVGLDPDRTRMPLQDVSVFNKAIIEATADLVCAYKPNFAFYEQLGKGGLEALDETLRTIPSNISVIGDAKRTDIGSTSAAYARALFETWGVDATTVNPYFGQDALEPFFAYPDKGVFVLCRTSNPGARDFQDLQVTEEGKSRSLYQVVASKARAWNTHGNVGLVVGATYPSELEEVRRICGDMPILIPGVGAQGGDLEAAVKNGVDSDGRGILINVSRQVLYAGNDVRTFARAARDTALQIRNSINTTLLHLGKGWS